MMKKYIASLLIGLFAFPIMPAHAGLSESDRALLYGRNFLVNPGAEASTAGVVASTSAHLGTDSANVDVGNAAFKWSPTGAGETLTFGFVNIASGAGLSGQAGVLSCKFKSVNGVQSHSMAGWDGSSLINSATLSPTSASFGRRSIQVNFPTSGNYTLRLTSGAADTLYIDSCYLGTAEGSPLNVLGMAGSNWISYTPTFTGFGTVSTSNMYYRRVGDSVQVHGTFVSGTVTGSQAQVSFPTGLTVDSSKSPSSTYYAAGQFARNTAPSSAGAFYAITEGGQSTLSFGIESTTLTPLTPQNASAIFTTGDTISIYATAPIAGWDAGVSISPSQTYKISSYLASGTRVTSTPTALGQYRTYKKTINSNAGTDDAPTTGPSVSDGMEIFSAAYNVAGTTGQPNRWEIFVGKNKQIKFDWYQTTGRTGAMDTKYFTNGSTADYGVLTGYDPTTGVVFLDTMTTLSSSNTTRKVGFNILANASSTTDQTFGYFDITVSDNALAVGMDATQVISNNKNERVERATLSLTAAGTVSITSQSGSWISSVSASSNVITVNETAGMFSAPPSCSFTCSNTPSSGTAAGILLSAGITTSTFNFGCVSGSNSLVLSTYIYVICMGPR